jgi:hypothetical protein
MGMQYRLKRTVKTFNVVEGQFDSFELPRGYDYEHITLQLKGTINVTVAGTAVRAEAPCQLLPRVELSSNGSFNHYSAPMWNAVFGHNDLSNGAAISTGITVPPTAASIAAYPVEATGVISLNTPDGERPKDSNLVTMGMSLFTLRLTYGTAAGCFTGAPTATFTGTVDVITSELVELDDAAGKRTMPAALRKTSTQEAVVTATTNTHEILLPAGNMVKSVLLRSEGVLTAGEPGVGTLNNISLQSGTDVRANVKAPALRVENAHMYGWFKNGYYMVDLTRCGGNTARLSEMWDLTRQAQPKVVSDVTLGAATTKVQAVVVEYVNLRGG